MMVELKSNIPSLTKESLSELRKIVRGGKDIAVSNQLRAMENVFKIMQWMKTEENKLLQKPEEDSPEQEEQTPFQLIKFE
jgi:hypothetical protein